MPARVARERFKQAESFAVYYGSGREDKLSRFDIAVVEPGGHDPEGIGKLKSAGTVVLAYVSAVEVNPSTPGRKLLREEDFVLRAGGPMRNESYGTKIVRLYSARWRSALVRHVEYLLQVCGYDGIFLDTLADLEFLPFSSEEYNKMLNAAIQLLTGIRSRFPQFLIVQNNGLESLYTVTSDYIDGVCWESPPKSGGPAELKQMERFLTGLSEKKHLKIFFLIHQSDENLRLMAESRGFLCYRSPDRFYLQC